VDKRKIEEKFFKGLMILSLLLIFSCLGLILVTITVKGLPALDWAMLSQIPRGGYYLGKEGGILNAIIGSLYVAGGAAILAMAVSLPVRYI